MTMDIFTKITNLPTIKTTKIGHETTNFIDDSTNVVYTKDLDNLEEYINKFYILLESIYTINKLSINKN